MTLTRQTPVTQDTVEQLVTRIIVLYHANPVDFSNTGKSDGEMHYLNTLKPTYVRTISDILSLVADKPHTQINVLEIGAYLGIVSIALSELGFKVTATEIPEYASCPQLINRLSQANVNLVACNLKDYQLPFETEQFDIVISCETLEHLNFNPLPVFKEINRVLTVGGALYIATPNLASLSNRLRLWQGHSIHGSVKEFAWQLDGSKNMIVGIHWREYTGEEIQEMMEMMGFSLAVQRCEVDPADRPLGTNSGRKMIKDCLHWVFNLPPVKRAVLGCYFDPCDPKLGSTLVSLGRKQHACTTEFHFTDATLAK